MTSPIPVAGIAVAALLALGIAILAGGPDIANGLDWLGDQLLPPY